MTTNLEQNTIGLEEILTTVNELPEAGSGDSGGSIETCTVTFSCPANYNIFFYYVENEEVHCRAVCYPFAITTTTLNLSNIIKGSFFVCGKSVSVNTNVKHSISGEVEFISSSGTELIQNSFTCGKIFKINGDCTITITE